LRRLVGSFYRAIDRTIGEILNPAVLAELENRVTANQSVAMVTVLDQPDAGQALVADSGLLAGGFTSDGLREVVLISAARYLADLRSGRERVRVDGQSYDVFFDVYPPPPQLIIIGAVHVAVHLIALARQLDYRTVVIDPRTAFATEERFAAADELLREWPAQALSKLAITDNTYFALLSHDLKLDLPALELALGSPARYIGALGSKKTHAKRVAALEETGFGKDDIARIRNPIGLDLGGRTAEEIALAVMAEIVAARHGRV